MFHLIMSNEFVDWDKEPGDAGTNTFPLGRFLEYTDKQIEKRFQPLDDLKLETLSRLSTIFISEMREEVAGNSVHIYIGEINNLRIVGRDISYSYKIGRAIGQYLIRDRLDFESALDLASFEIHRTHWAIKEGNLSSALMKIGVGGYLVQTPRTADVVTTASEPDATLDVDVLPSVDDTAIPETSSIQGFVDWVMRRDGGPDGEIFYRGHFNREYALTPSLFRTHRNGVPMWRTKEQVIIRELMTSQARQFADDKSMLDHLVRMQHYGLPTRLLDLTSNPLVALYFSCTEPGQKDTDAEIDGEVICMIPKAADVKFFDSDTVSLISCLSLLTYEQQNDLNTRLSVRDFKRSDSGRRLLDFVRREKPHFLNNIDPRDLEKILFVRGRSTHERIASQSGSFLLFGKDTIRPDSGLSFKMERIRIKNKGAILNDLAKLNIKASTVYPGLEKAADDIKKMHRSPVPMDGALF